MIPVLSRIRGPWWDAVLALVTAAIGAYLVHAFYPGRANNDIVNQAQQALGEIPYSDWHPPVVAALWEWLIGLTGEIGSLLVVQLVLMSLGSFGLGLLVHHRLASRLGSFLAVLLPVFPWSLSQLNIMWKDVQMATAFLLAVVLVFLVRLRPRALWVLLVPAAVLLVYGTLARKNAVFALVPIAVYLGWMAWSALAARRERLRTTRIRFWGSAVSALVVLGVLGGATLATDSAIVRAKDVQPTGQISQIMLDDVMFSVPESELNASAAPQELKDHINTARAECIDQGEIWDAYWNCYGRGETGEYYSPIAFQDELQDLWFGHVLSHPVRYAEYRAAVFSQFFFSSALEYWELGWDADASRVELGDGSRNAEFVIRAYVLEFALKTFPMLFKPWFWFLAGGLLLVGARRLRVFRAEVVVLSTSAMFYITGYFPIAPANHFRYTYWPALAVTAAALLWWCARRKQREQDRGTVRS